MSTKTFWVWMMLAWVSSASAKSVTMTVVVRDHLAGKATEMQITGKMWDSTAGSWTGTRPQVGIQGLPTPEPQYVEGVRTKYRFPLSPTQATLGWPGRIAARLDVQADEIHSGQHCSASLIGPKYAMTAAHCVLYPSTGPTIQDGWYSDSFYLRPGYNLGQSASGFDQIRVIKSTVLRTKFPGVPEYTGDDEWAILELERDVGTELGWARVIPIDYSNRYQRVHMMGYPLIPEDCPKGEVCDMATKTDTLCHYWSDMNFRDGYGVMAWSPRGEAWGGESGSGVFRCPDDSCRFGGINLIGVRWTTEAIGSIDSAMSGIIANILKDVKVPTASVASADHPGFSMRMDRGYLNASADRDGEWQILSLDGRAIGRPSYGRNLFIPADRLPRGVALVVFRTPGQAPVTRRWVAR